MLNTSRKTHPTKNDSVYKILDEQFVGENMVTIPQSSIMPPNSKVYLPKKLRLKKSTDGTYEFAELLPMTKALGQKLTDSWWNGHDWQNCKEHEDCHWSWSGKVPSKQPNQKCEGFVVVTPDKAIQGGLVLKYDQKSFLEPSKPAVYVDYIATAPWNRKTSSRTRLYPGIGERLLLYSVIKSHNLGFGGRIVLCSLPNAEDFYEVKIKMQRTGKVIQTMNCFELSENKAQEWMRKKGLIK